ncbi:vacuolar fusion protein CCZ1 homolog isoform X1 [Thrips palmi]|uniref:Vacuolar fusion protein CCZ1 homolog isoform X1 n=1 Tax=Thrips palmi TaxID=161013 RepID=A0A6P9A1U9_THRPL|nr:vacuolar fusion protein CCZ1 homolog isoform X1 [Thrips palmi]
MAHDSPLSLKYFYIYNSSYGQKEGEEAQKILYYYPTKTDLDSQIKNVGLTEAIIKFTETFNCNQQCESLHTQKTRQLYYQPEDGFWMVLVLTVPTATKTKEGIDHLEYQSDEVQDNIYWAVLKQAYRSFQLFNGSFSNILDSEKDPTKLRYKLDHFFAKYLIKLKPQHADILDVFHGIQFLPLDKKTFLHVQTLVNLLECSFPKVRHTAFLYNDQLVWSGLEPDDMQAMYRYLITSLLPAQMETELQGGPMPRQSAAFSALHFGSRFVSGPSNLQGDDVGKIPKVYLKNDDGPVICHLVIYRALNATVCLFIDEAVSLEMDFFQRLDIFLGHRLTSLGSEIAEQFNHSVASAASAESGAKFVYFNQLNRAQKSTIHLDNRKSGNISVPVDVLRILADVNADFMERKPTTGETIVKTMNDFWVVGKLSNLREFYVVIHHKNANLIEINEEVKKLCDSQFKSIFFNE